MECRHVDELMMKYMDKSLIKNEAEILKKHVSECKSCAADFALYDEMMINFEETELLEAPSGFDSSVLLKLESIDFSYKKISAGMESFMLAALGVISIIVASAFMLIANKDQILEFMSGYASLQGLVSVLTPLSALVEQFFVNLSTVLATFAASASNLFFDYRFVFFGVFVAIVGVWFFVSRRGRAEE